MTTSHHPDDVAPTGDMGEAKLTVETAAIRIGEAVFTLPRPNRHHNILWWLSALGVSSSRTHDQGFMLSSGCYVDRISAAHHAAHAGQLAKPLIAPPNLYSEDLWDGGYDMPSIAAIQALTAPPASSEQFAKNAKNPPASAGEAAELAVAMQRCRAFVDDYPVLVGEDDTMAFFFRSDIRTLLAALAAKVSPVLEGLDLGVSQSQPCADAGSGARPEGSGS